MLQSNKDKSYLKHCALLETLPDGNGINDVVECLDFKPELEVRYG